MSIHLAVEMTGQEREALARRHVDSAEAWLRRIINFQMSREYGPDFFSIEGLIKKAIREYVASKRAADPGKFVRAIDATTFDQAVDIATNPEFFNRHFKLALQEAYPLGREEARNYLTRLKDIRNDVSHGHNCTARQLEQAICYSNDLISSLKTYFKDCNMQKKFNVPTIVRFGDNLGNTSLLENLTDLINLRIIDWRQSGNGELHPGETLVAEIDIDPSFDLSDYEITWTTHANESGTGPVAKLVIENKHVRNDFKLAFSVISKLDWHKYSDCDDQLMVIYRVLPPVS
jgi:hypothetical protein